MTITMAVQEGDVVVMACDSAATDDSFELMTRKGCSKAWVQPVRGVGEMLVGFSGNFSTGLWIRHGFKWPRKMPEDSMESWLVKKVQPLLSECLKNRFTSESDENRTAWQLLVARPRETFKLHACGDVESCSLPYACIGDGAQVAQGALHVLAESVPSWQALEAAFQACVSCRASVRGPLHMLALGLHGTMHID